MRSVYIIILFLFSSTLIGIAQEKNDEIVIYDNSDVISSCRGWFNLIYKLFIC